MREAQYFFCFFEPLWFQHVQEESDWSECIVDISLGVGEDPVSVSDRLGEIVNELLVDDWSLEDATFGL